MPLPFDYEGYSITSEFGAHHGLDFGIPVNTPIWAPVSGVVETAKVLSRKSNHKEGSYGVYVVIRDDAGNRHFFAHLNDFFVAPGQRVDVGTVIGRSGNTGNSSGPHLHYEIRNAQGKQVDPTGIISDGVIPEGDFGFPEQQPDSLPLYEQFVERTGLPDLDPAGFQRATFEVLGRRSRDPDISEATLTSAAIAERELYRDAGRISEAPTHEEGLRSVVLRRKDGRSITA